MEDIKEKTADELFSELGYEIVTANYNVEEECIIYGNKDKECIYFSLEDKCIAAYDEEQLYKCGTMSLIPMQELQAINKKCQELRLVRR
jgi:hypothetical protein